MYSMDFHPPNNRHYDQNAVSLPPFSNHGPYGGSSGAARQHHSSHQPQRPSYFSMDSHTPAGEETAPLTGDSSFDILDWHPAYQSCQRYFLDYAQHEPATQALCALINIKLPYQWLTTPITSANPNNGLSPAHSSQPSNGQFTFSTRFPSNNNQPSPSRSRQNGPREPPTFISLVPYIRRLVITGFDKPSILHGFFGDDYTRGVLPHVDCERRNYLFAAKHGGWRTCKKQYDTGSGGGGDDETVPFMKPLEEAKLEELNAAEKAWSGWLAMEDWMVGPRAPEEGDEYTGQAQAHSGSGGRSEQMPDGAPEDDHRRM